MGQVEKRALLRASGVQPLPRPREGKHALDAVLLDLMDAAVRDEYIRLSTLLRLSSSSPSSSSSASSSSSLSAQTTGEDSDRGGLLRRMGEALCAGDIETATALRQQFAHRTALRADPTQAVGAYDQYLDQDGWYAEARRRAMAPRDKQ